MLTNIVLIHVKIQQPAAVMQFVLLVITNRNVHVKLHLLEILQLAVDCLLHRVKNTPTVPKDKLAMEMNAELHVETIKTV